MNEKWTGLQGMNQRTKRKEKKEVSLISFYNISFSYSTDLWNTNMKVLTGFS